MAVQPAHICLSHSGQRALGAAHRIHLAHRVDPHCLLLLCLTLCSCPCWIFPQVPWSGGKVSPGDFVGMIEPLVGSRTGKWFPSCNIQFVFAAFTVIILMKHMYRPHTLRRTQLVRPCAAHAHALADNLLACRASYNALDTLCLQRASWQPLD